MNIVQKNYKAIINPPKPIIQKNTAVNYDILISDIAGLQKRLRDAGLNDTLPSVAAAAASALSSSIVSATKKTALLVGINYTNTSSKLNGCINDTQNIAKLLRTKGYTCSLMSELTPVKATKNNILNALTQLLVTANNGDSLFFHFSGHGTRTMDRNGDELDGTDEMICPCDFNMITDDELSKLVHTHLKPNVTLFALFDSCFSGTVLDLKYNYEPNVINPRVAETKSNVIMISGCMDSQTSADAFLDRQWCGAMTNAFLTCVNSPSLNSLIKNMRTYLKNKKFSQIPQLSTGKLVNINTNILYF